MQARRDLLLPGTTAPAFTARGLLAAIFRQRRVVAITVAAVFIPILLAVVVRRGEYEAETKILVQRQRFDPVITSGMASDSSGDTTVLRRLEEPDVDAEIDLLQSEDLLRRVVIASDLWSATPRWRSLLPIPLPSQEKRIAVAVRELRKNLTVEPPNKSNMVTVRYRARDPQKAAGVLQKLSDLYLEKHLQVHRPAGSSEFFNQEVERNRRALQEAESRRVEFTKSEGVVSAAAEDATLIQQIAIMDSSLEGTKAQIAGTQQRILNLLGQLKTVPPRVTTMVKTSPLLLENLKTTLHGLELKRAELLTKYNPSYRLVKDLDLQIEQARASIGTAEQAPSAERTTDQDPVYAWLRSDLAKAQTELYALRAGARKTEETLRDYRSRAVRLSELDKQQQELGRAVKVAEEAYLASLRQQSEARMSEALDRSRIMNVAIAEAAAVPALPVRSPLTQLALGLALALMLGIGLAIAFDYWDPSFRSPQEVEAVLAVPVLAAVPQPQLVSAESGRELRLLAS